MRPYLAAAFLVSASSTACNDAGGDTTLHTPVMTEKVANSAALVWQSPGESTLCIEYWQAGVDKAALPLLSCGLKDEFQQVVLSGLRQETRYAYRITSADNKDTANGKATARDKGKVYEFTTGSAIDEARHFAVMGDSHGNQEVVRDLLARTLKERTNLDFLLHVGDAVDDGNVAGSWNADFIEPARSFLAAVPVHVAMGNHEKGEPPPFLLPALPGADLPTVDSFTSGNAFIVLADTNQDFSVGSPQYQDLQQRLSSPEALAATWRFVAFHHPPFAAGWGSCNGYDGDTDVRETLVPLLGRLGVDVVFNGHVHGYERGAWQGVTYVTTGGGGGSLDHACTQWPPIVVSHYVHHIVSVDVVGMHLSVTARALGGAVIDHFELQR